MRQNRSASSVAAAILLTLTSLVSQPSYVNAQGDGQAEDGRLAFIRGGDLFTVASDGSGERRVKKTTQTESSPAWSADGHRIAFRRGGTAKVAGLYTAFANPDIGTEDRASSFTRYLDVDWSPDGETFAATAKNEADRDVHLVPLTGSTEFLLFGEEIQQQPAWSPDGTMIAFTLGEAPSQQLYVIDVDGDGLSQLSAEDPATTSASQPSWSPDGSRIAYTSVTSGVSTISVMDSDGTNESVIAGSEGASNPTWSPSGSRIAFTKNDPTSGLPALFTMTPDGGDVIDLGVVGDQPDWGPAPTAPAPSDPETTYTLSFVPPRIRDYTKNRFVLLDPAYVHLQLGKGRSSPKGFPADQFGYFGPEQYHNWQVTGLGEALTVDAEALASATYDTQGRMKKWGRIDAEFNATKPAESLPQKCGSFTLREGILTGTIEFDFNNDYFGQMKLDSVKAVLSRSQYDLGPLGCEARRSAAPLRYEPTPRASAGAPCPVKRSVSLGAEGFRVIRKGDGRVLMYGHRSDQVGTTYIHHTMVRTGGSKALQMSDVGSATVRGIGPDFSGVGQYHALFFKTFPKQRCTKKGRNVSYRLKDSHGNLSGDLKANFDGFSFPVDESPCKEFDDPAFGKIYVDCAHGLIPWQPL